MKRGAPAAGRPIGACIVIGLPCVIVSSDLAVSIKCQSAVGKIIGKEKLAIVLILSGAALASLETIPSLRGLRPGIHSSSTVNLWAKGGTRQNCAKLALAMNKGAQPCVKP